MESDERSEFAPNFSTTGALARNQSKPAILKSDFARSTLTPLAPRELADSAVELRQVNVLIGIQPDAMNVETAGVRLVRSELR